MPKQISQKQTARRPKSFISVSTKTGDKGTTGLANGERLSKDEMVFEVMGTMDEFNSHLGLLVAKMGTQFPLERDFLLLTQDTLFHIGAELARSPKTKFSDGFLKQVEERSEGLQQSMAADWIMKFILPGGTELAAAIDVSRTVCRRLERVLVRYSTDQPVRPVILKTINRYSDYLFVLRCYVNHQLGYEERVFETKSNYIKQLKTSLSRLFKRRK
jgi:cob(I)alamin adenosyltransferase